MPAPIYAVVGAEHWTPELWPGPSEAVLTSTCPQCAQPIRLNIQLEADGDTSTELWCHRCSIGEPVTIVEVKLTMKEAAAIDARIDKLTA